MTEDTPPLSSGEEGASERLEKSIRLYTEIGLAPEQAVAQLLMAGHDRALVRARFPQLPASAFPEATATRGREQRARAIESRLLSSRTEEGVDKNLPPTANALLQRMLAKPM